MNMNGMGVVYGVGTDLVSIARIKTIWHRFGLHFARRILAKNEWIYFNQNKNPVHFLAKRFAAKEALAKALGTGFRPEGVLLTEIAVLNDDLGRPYLELTGNTKKLIEKFKVKTHISLSDEREYAMAFVLLVPDLDIRQLNSCN